MGGERTVVLVAVEVSATWHFALSLLRVLTFEPLETYPHD
jgi:hypothetical protein